MTTALQDPPTNMLPVDRDQVRVLVVEDSPDHRMLIERSLRGAGYLVTGASTGEQALDMLLDVEVVLIDQRLPQMSGTDLLREIVALPTGPAPVIVTGTESRELVVEALRLGAVDYVVKSADYLGELPAVVERAHRQHDLARRYRELQRFALLVHEPTARDDAVSEIVAGARRLLSVDGASLLRREASGSWEVTARDGEVGDLDDAVAMVASGRDEVVRDRGVTVVRLPADPDEPPGALVLVRSGGAELGDEELELATTFAALAASALRQVRRLELERDLIDELQRSVRSRQDFLASVSHELRTPLTVISGYVETLIHRYDAISADKRTEVLERVLSNADELHRLVNQLLDAAAIERGRSTVQTRPVDLADVVGAAATELAYHLDDRPGTRTVPSVRVEADPDLLRLTLVNLLSNACKYSAAATSVDLSVHVDDDQVRVDVRDQGVGIDPSDAHRVFEPFWRASAAVTHGVRGTGIGLSLVREYVTAMGGEVGVESTPATGSTFWFTLPRTGVTDQTDA